MLGTRHICNYSFVLNIVYLNVGFRQHFLLFGSVVSRCKLIEKPDLCLKLLHVRGDFLIISFRLGCTQLRPITDAFSQECRFYSWFRRLAFWFDLWLSLACY